ncbi:hypothetical protein KCP70_02845 [Salmonella enterica subsp. enterica]|nr:hypothetical protein KCP70_02845 [Salmonella enterica subsp. enterica]
MPVACAPSGRRPSRGVCHRRAVGAAGSGARFAGATAGTARNCVVVEAALRRRMSGRWRLRAATCCGQCAGRHAASLADVDFALDGLTQLSVRLNSKRRCGGVKKT